MIVFDPDTIVPDLLNPIVESTLITDAPIDTFSRHFVF